VAARNGAGAAVSAIYSFTTETAPGARIPTLTWQNMSTREAALWFMGGPQNTTMQNWTWLAAQGVPGWSIVARADLDGNATPDLIWQNDTTRQVSVWYMGGAQGATFLNSDWISEAPVPGWEVVAAGDFNGDSKPDLFWRNETTAEVAVWFMGGIKGNVMQSWAWLTSLVLSNWKIVALADLDGNGRLDIIWQHTTTRQVSYWLIGGAQGDTLLASGWLSAAPVPGWRVAGATDLDGNGKPDLIWQNDSTQQATVWFMGGAEGTVSLGTAWIAENGVNGWRVLTP
jgi:hypothetical protein